MEGQHFEHRELVRAEDGFLALSSRGEGAVGEVVGGSEAAVVAREQFRGCPAMLDERAEAVEGLGECDLQRAAGREAVSCGGRDQGLQQPGVDEGGREQGGRRNRPGAGGSVRVRDRVDRMRSWSRRASPRRSSLSPMRSVSQPRTARAAAECPMCRADRNSSIAIAAHCSGLASWSPESERAWCSSASPCTRAPRSTTAAPWTACRADRSGGRGGHRFAGLGLGAEAFGLGGLGAQEFGVGQDRGGGARPRRVLPAVVGRNGEGLAAHGTHPPQVSGSARDDTQQGEAFASSGSRTCDGCSGSRRHRTRRGPRPGRRAGGGCRPGSGGSLGGGRSSG